MLVLDRDVEAVRVGQLLGRHSRGVVAIYEHRHVYLKYTSIGRTAQVALTR
jgi:hypothetical protein